LSSLQTFLRESTWGYPIIAAIHVLGLAWFGGTVLASPFIPELQRWRRAGLALLLLSGVVLFWLHPVRYSASTSFQAKLVLLLAALFAKPGKPLSILLWILMIFASRGIAFG